MSVKKIKDFPDGSGSLSNDDIFLFMDDPSNGGTTKKISLSQISAAIGGGGGGGNLSIAVGNIDLHNGGVQSAQVLQFDNASKQSVITGPTPASGTNSQRIIVQGQRATGNGEGGDVYLWGGDSDINGGDIKIYAGDADAVPGDGGYVNIEGGSGYANGGNVTLTGGPSSENGGDIRLIAGTDNNGGGEVRITTGNGTKEWQFNNSGNLNIPGNILLNNGTSVAVGSYDNGTGGNNGVSLNCAVGYELNWQGGRLRNTFIGDNTATPQNIYVDSPLSAPPVVLGSSSYTNNINTDAAVADMFDIILNENSTLANPLNPVNGKTVRWRITQDGTGNRTVTLGNKFNLPSSASSPLPWSTAANKMDILAATYHAGRDKWDIVAFVPGY